MPATTARRDQPAKRKARREADDELPLFAGRMLIGAGMLLAMVVFPMSKLGDLLEPRQTKDVPEAAAWSVGQTSRVQITMITADYNLLTCASAQEIEGKHCAYKSETETWPRAAGDPIDDNKKDVIQPYRTWPDNRLVLVAGLWADPAVALRLQREPSMGVEQKRLSRFVADCRMRFIGTLKNPKLRWPSGSQWLQEGDAMVGVPESCTITTQEE